MKANEISVTIPRRSGKRLTVIAKAMQLAKEGKKVAIFDIGGQVKVLEPLSKKERRKIYIWRERK